MPARSALVPKYCVHKPSGRAYVRIQGKVVYVGAYGTDDSKAAYGRLVAELAASCGAAVPRDPTSELTVVELCAAYLDHASGYYQKNGQPTRTLGGIKAVVRTVKKLYGREPVSKFSPICLLAIQLKLASTGVSRGYVNRQVAWIKRMFKWGVSRALVPPAVHTALSTVEGLRKGRTAAREPEPVQPVADDVVYATLPHLPAVVADMVRFQRLTGARPGEVCGIRPCDIDRSGEVWTYHPQSHKTEHCDRQRVVFIGPLAQAVLLRYVLRDVHAYCFSPAESVAKQNVEKRACRKTRVQPSQVCRRKRRPKKSPSNHYNRQSYCQAIQRGVEKANRERTKEADAAGVEPVVLERWHPNRLRHSKATEIRRQFGLEAAQVILGHAKADVTQVYAERDARLAVEVTRRIGQHCG